MYIFFKRFFDICTSVLLIVILLPVFLAISIAIIIEGKGPVFYKQTRVGKDGALFTILKFRSLPKKAHDLANPRSIATPLGLFMRRWGLDELPQLWNVIRGDMSIVGPRPTLQEQVEAYGPYERKRLVMTPGITGLAQINGRNAIDWPRRIKLDIEYIERASIGLDIKIVLMTPISLLAGNGVYGPKGINNTFKAIYQKASSSSR